MVSKRTRTTTAPAKGGKGREPGDDLLPEQRAVLDLVADHQLNRGQRMTGVMLRSQMSGRERDSKKKLIDSIERVYLDPVLTYPSDEYELTLWGWLVSMHATRVRELLAKMLQFLKDRLADEPDFKTYSWSELIAKGVVRGDPEQYFAVEVLSKARLLRGGSPNAWYRPEPIEEIADLPDMDALIRWNARKAVETFIREERGRQRIARGLLPWDSDPEDELSAFSEEEEMEDELRFTSIFISHSSKDKDLATTLVRCIEACMALPEDAILCTSVPGYMLDPGDNTDETLRDSLERSKVVIGLLTEESLRSMYVTMELGAAWVLGKTFIGVLAGAGAGFTDIPGPMKGLIAIRAVEEERIHDMVNVIARETGNELKKDSLRIAAVKEFVSKARMLAGKKKRTG